MMTQKYLGRTIGKFILMVAIAAQFLYAHASTNSINTALDAYAKSNFKDSSAIDTIFRHLNIEKKKDESNFLEKIENTAKSNNLDAGKFETRIRKVLDKKRFDTVDGILKDVYQHYGKDLDVVVRTGSSGARYLELAGKQANHGKYRLLFSDDDISFVGKKAIEAADYFNKLIEAKGLETLKVKGFDIVHLKNIRGIDLNLLNLLEKEKFVGDAAMSGIKKEMLTKGAVIASNKGGQLVEDAEPLRSFVQNATDNILTNELSEEAIRGVVKKRGAMTMIGSCERQITQAHGGWDKLADPEKVKYVLRQRIALDESGALKDLKGMDSSGIKSQLEHLGNLKAQKKLTKANLRWLRRIRAQNIELAFEEIPFKLNPILQEARASGHSLAATPQVRKTVDELTLGFVLMREHILDIPEQQILEKLSKIAGGNRDLYRMLYTSFQQGKELTAMLDKWTKLGLSREYFVKTLLKAETHLARLELIKARQARLPSGSNEVRTLKEVESATASKEGDRFLLRLLKGSAGQKIFIAALGAAGGAVIYKEMHNAWAAGQNQLDLSDAAFALMDFVPGGMSFKRAGIEGVSPGVIFSFVKEALYITPAWPLVLMGDMAVLSVDMHSALRIRYNQKGLVKLLVYAGDYTDDFHFIRLNLPKAAANKKRIIEKDQLPDFFFNTKTVVVPVAGMNNTYRISNLSKVSEEILDQTFLENDPVTQQLRTAAQQQLTNISHDKTYESMEKGNNFSGLFEYAKWMTGFSTICQKSPEKWCRVFNLLKKQIITRHDFVKKQIMIPTLIREAEKEYAAWTMGNKPPVAELASIQKKLEELRNEPLKINLAQKVGKRADEVEKRAVEARETLEQQKLRRGEYWKMALKAYETIYQQYRKRVKGIASKLNIPENDIRKRILRFPWTGDYKKDAENAQASRIGFALGVRNSWDDVKKIKETTPDPIKKSIDQKALHILSEVQFRWRKVLDGLGYPNDDVDSSEGFKKKYQVALTKVRSLYDKERKFQALIEKEALIDYGTLRVGAQTSFAVRFLSDQLQTLQDKNILRITWHSDHGDFGSDGRGLKVNFKTMHLLPVTVEAIIQDRRDPAKKGILSVQVPVEVPKGLFYLTIKPDKPKAGEFVRAEVKMPDQYINAYNFHYKWWGKGCRVEGGDRFYAVVTAPKHGEASVSARITAEYKGEKNHLIASDKVVFKVQKRHHQKPLEFTKAEEGKEDQKTKAKADEKNVTTKEVSGDNATVTVPTEESVGKGEGVKDQGVEDRTDKADDKTSKKKVKHGAGGSVSGMYPAKTFNGLQISYSFSGASMPKMEDIHSFTTSRHYEGRLGDGTMTLSGTARATWSPYVVLTVSVSAGGEHDEKTYKFDGPGSESFNLSIPIPKDATSGGFNISMDASYGNGEDRGLSVSGNASADGPEGEPPKGTEKLTLEITAPKDKIPISKKVDITAQISGGRFPYTYTWSGAEGKEEKAVFQSNTPGEHTVTLRVTDIEGNTVSKSVKMIVQVPEFEIMGLPSRPVYASTAQLRIRVKSGSMENFKPIWIASEPGIEFDPPDGMETTVTFGRVKKIAIWVQIPQPDGGKTLESNQIHTEVISPKFILSTDPDEPFVGEEVHAKIESSTKLPEGSIQWYWSSPSSSNRMEYNDPASEIGFTLNDTKPLKLESEARVPHWNDVIGSIKDQIKAQKYNVSISKPKRLDKAPWRWDPKQGKAVELPQAIAVFQDAEVHCKITPKPKEKVKYQWTVSPEGCTVSAPMSKSTYLNAHETGSYTVFVEVKDKNNVVLGKGSTTFTVTVSQRDLDVHKQKEEDQKKAKESLQKSRNLWKEGKLQRAIAKVSQGKKLAGKNKEISKTLKAMQIQKKDLDAKLDKASNLIKNGKLKDAEAILSQAARISDKYKRYKEVSKQLADAKKKAEEKKKQIAKLLKDAKVLKDAGKLNEAVTILKKGSGNKKIDKLLREVKTQQNVAHKKMTEGQRQWKNGVLDKAVSILKEAAKIDMSNRQITKVLKGMESQKKMMDNALKKADGLISQKKFKKAQSTLIRAKYVSRNYPRYVTIVKKLASAEQDAVIATKAEKKRQEAEKNTQETTKKVSEQPTSKDLAYAESFAGKWNSTYGVMTLTVQGLHVSGSYTHDKGRIDALLSQDAKTMKGTWAEAPSYKGSHDAGKMYFKLSSDGKKIDGLWSYGDAVPTRRWTATRIVDAQSQSPEVVQPGQIPPKETEGIKQLGKNDSSQSNSITILSATYGANCGMSSGNVTPHIAKTCNGKYSCRYTVDYKKIGDPAIGCRKTYSVKYRCGNNPQVLKGSLAAEAGWGDKSILLDCRQNKVEVTTHEPNKSAHDISGTWKWFDGETIHIYPNGTATDGFKGKWQANWNGSGFTYTINWNNGQYIDSLVLHGDTLDGHNQNGTHVWGKRIISSQHNETIRKWTRKIQEEKEKNDIVSIKNPKVNGVALDYCREWAKNCGKPAADAWCQTNGYGESISYVLKNDTPPTRIISTKQICKSSFCGRIVEIKCKQK